MSLGTVADKDNPFLANQAALEVTYIIIHHQLLHLGQGGITTCIFNECIDWFLDFKLES